MCLFLDVVWQKMSSTICHMLIQSNNVSTVTYLHSFSYLILFRYWRILLYNWAFLFSSVTSSDVRLEDTYLANVLGIICVEINYEWSTEKISGRYMSDLKENNMMCLKVQYWTHCYFYYIWTIFQWIYKGQRQICWLMI